MKKLYILFLIFSVSVQGASSDTIAVFSESVKANFKKYVSLSNKAYNKKNYEKAEKYNKSGEWLPYRGGLMITYKLN